MIETFRPCGASNVFSAGALSASVAKEASTPPSTSSISPTETAFDIVIFIVTILSGLEREAFAAAVQKTAWPKHPLRDIEWINSCGLDEHDTHGRSIGWYRDVQ